MRIFTGSYKTDIYYLTRDIVAECSIMCKFDTTTKIIFLIAYINLATSFESRYSIRRRETKEDINNYIQYLKDYDVFYVDGDNGNDRFTGLSPWRHGYRRLGPFRTISVAIRKIRIFRRSLSLPVKLYIRSGFYFIKKQIRMTEKDSNLEILGYPFDNERPVISGARRVWGSQFFKVHQLANLNWIYKLSYEGGCSPHLFVGNKRMVRARKPNIYEWNGRNLAGEGPYMLIHDVLISTDECKRGNDVYYQKCPPKNKVGFRMGEGDIVKNGTNEDQIQILIFHAWTAERAYINRISRDNRILFRESLREAIGTRPRPSGWRYIIENSHEELDAVGEFYCDPVRKALYIIPPNETFMSEYVYIGNNAQLFKVVDASNITFNGIEVKYTHDDSVGWFNSKPSALEFENCSHIKIMNSVIGHLGHNGIVIEESRQVEIFGNQFYDIGNYAVNIADTGKRKSLNSMRSRDVIVANNTFDGCGVYHMLQPSCVHVRGIRNITILGNDVRNTPYAGIKVGWQKSFSPKHSSASHPVFYVAENHVSEYGLAILNDFAGIYLSTNMRDCGILQRLEKCHLHALITRNVVHQGRSYNYGAAGIYSDTAASSVTVSNNWIYDVGGPAINFHCGQNNTATNNMIVHVNPNRIFGTCNHANANGDRSRQIFSMLRNVIYVENPLAAMYRRGDWWDFDVPYLNFNVYFGGSVRKKTFFPKYVSIKKWKKDTRNDMDSMIVHPRFTSTSHRILTLKKHSPAIELGIRSIDLSNVRDGISNKWMFVH
uniref:uncharacterized protein LOC120341895 isoform X1 n=1 Tax=Styela clava TaxID=7725 RepID=UPI00193941BA|nr:uncharacterized protein LOC120341895 isoform X1 [Styela clava]